MFADRAPANRFIVQQTLLVRSTRPDQVLAASQKIGELATIGVVVSASTAANQGIFEIVGREQAPGIMSEGQVAKLVRVVSTVEYFLD